MNFFKKLFGRGKTSEQDASAPAVDSGVEEVAILVHDEAGREMAISRSNWRDQILLPNIERNWDDADQLASIIMQALQDGFFEEIVKAAERLLQLEPAAERAAVLLAVVYLKNQRIDDAERALMDFMSAHGETGIALTNLAKVYAEHGDEVRSTATLWHALELDPNQDNALGWYEAIHREEGGDASAIAAMRRVAELPNSWMARAWLAAVELRAGNLDGAMRLYRDNLAQAGSNAPASLLMTISGDLGNAGHLQQIIDLVAPAFDPARHGLHAGDNLIKAYVRLGQLERAREVVASLAALQRPDWRQALDAWADHIAKTQHE